MTVGQWCVTGDAHATANNGTGDMAGPSGGRTVLAPSPTGEGISSLPLPPNPNLNHRFLCLTLTIPALGQIFGL